MTNATYVTVKVTPVHATLLPSAVLTEEKFRMTKNRGNVRNIQLSPQR